VMFGMENLKIGLLLHFYQPWWQFPAVLHKIVNQCYRPILELVNSSDRFCFTANVNLSLLELLEKDFPDVVSGFKEAAEKGRIELMGSSAQHPIMPLIPEFLQRAQIEEDEHCKKSQFDIMRNCRGFFFPEMAFARKDVRILKDYGYKWTVIDDKIFGAKNPPGSVPFNRIVTYEGFKVFMRSRTWSNIISFDHPDFDDFRSRLEHDISDWTKDAPAYLIIAMDAETFGHHQGDLFERLLKPMLYNWAGSKIMPIESIGQSFPTQSVPYLHDSSWSTEIEDLDRSNPYPLWSRFTTAHANLWDLVELALKHFDSSRQDCLKMTSSCHWWWISRSGWNPDFMMKGAKKAIEITRTYGTSDEKKVGEELYEKLKKVH